jgi:hypothetical protein
VQEAVLQAGAGHFDVVGQLEAALEGTRSDAPIKQFRTFLAGLLLALALDAQHVAMRFDRNLILGEAGNRHGNPIGVLAGALDIVGRIGLGAIRLRKRIEHRKEPVKADGRAIEG